MYTIRKVWAMYFSPTGTTEKVVLTIAKRLAYQLELPLEIYDYTLPKMRTHGKHFESGDLVVFGGPTYAGRIPNVLLKYLATVTADGALAVPVALYGNRNYDDSLIEARDLLEKNGFHTVAGAAFIGEHSFSRTLGAGRPDVEDLALAEMFGMAVAKKLQSTEDPVALSPAKVRGEQPIRPYYQPRDRKGNPINILKVKPLTSDACTKCGICAEICPMGSISREDPSQFTGICIKCGACEKKCPEGAKYYDDEGYLYHKTELELGYERRAKPELFL